MKLTIENIEQLIEDFINEQLEEKCQDEFYQILHRDFLEEDTAILLKSLRKRAKSKDEKILLSKLIFYLFSELLKEKKIIIATEITEYSLKTEDDMTLSKFKFEKGAHVEADEVHIFSPELQLTNDLDKRQNIWLKFTIKS
jgi:adenylate cyclase class IV